MQIHWEKVSNGEPAIGRSCILWWDKRLERDLFNKEEVKLARKCKPLLSHCMLTLRNRPKAASMAERNLLSSDLTTCSAGCAWAIVR